MNKKILFFLGLAALFAAPNSSVSNVKAATYDASNWSTVATGTYGLDNNVWKVNSNNLVSTNNTKERSNFLISSELVASGDYTITCNINGTTGFPNTKLTHAGIVPWYVDTNNYVVIYMQWHPTDRNTQLHQVQVTGRIDGQFLSIWKDTWDNSSEWNDCWTDGKTIAQNSNAELKIERKFENGDSYRYKIYINNTYIGEHGIRGDMASAQVAGKVGFYAYNDTFTFTNITTSGGSSTETPDPTPSTDTRSDTVGDWEFVSPASASSSLWSLDGSNVTGKGAEGNSQWLKTSALQKNNSKKDFIMSADMNTTKLLPTDGINNVEYKVGLVPYYIDTNNYCFVWFNRWSDGKDCEVIVTAKVNGKIVSSPEFASTGWQSFDLTGSHSLKVQVKDDILQLWIDNSTIVKSFTLTGFSSRNLTNSKIGLNVHNVQTTFSNIKLLLDATEENPNTPSGPVIDPSGWEFISPNGASLWSIDSDGKVTGSGEQGTEWQNTSAYQANPGKKNFYMSSVIEVTTLGVGTNIYNGTTMNEYKAGLVPYFKDFNNFCFIWISQWADGTKAEISVTCKVNGTVLGAEEFMSSGWLSFGIQAKTTLEVDIRDDMINVWVNNNTSIPTASFPVTGFSNRDISSSKAGLNIMQVKATYSDIKLFLDSRPTPQGKPIISEMGTRVVDGVINQEIRLPVYTALDVTGMSINAITKVNDPNGENVTLERNRFTPTIVGEYSVKVTCTDTYGNVADPIEYTITVTDGLIPEGPENPDNPDGPNNPNEPGNPNEPNNPLDPDNPITNEFHTNLGTDPNAGATTLVAVAGGGSALSVVAIIINIVLKKRLK